MARLTDHEREGLSALWASASHAFLTLEDEQALGRRIQAGDPTALDELVLSNVALAIHEATGWRGSLGTVDVLDLTQEAVVAIRRAAMTYDPERGVRFSTYAVPWIRQALSRVTDQHQSVVSVPGKHQRAARRARRNGWQEVNGVDESVVATATRAAPLEWGDTGAERYGDSSGAVHRLEAALDIRRLLCRLPERMAIVVVLRDLRGWLLREIGDRLGVTRERARQLHVAALAGLRVAAQGGSEWDVAFGAYQAEKRRGQHKRACPGQAELPI